MQVIALPLGGTLQYNADFLARSEADALFETLLAELPLVQEDVVLFGRRIPQPRLSLWMGDPGATYRYSGVTREPRPWHGAVRALAERAAAVAGVPFNSVLCNLYRDGRDSMGFHADDEPELGSEPVIASLSLGAARTFVLRPKHKRDRAAGGHKLRLGHGSLLLMSSAVQRHWNHGIPKEQADGPRLNMTFRRIER